MKILYFNYIETNAGWGAECFVDSALRALGHEVVSIDFKKHPEDLVQKVLNAGDFDVVFLQRGDWFPKEILRAIHRPCVFWASELVMRCRDQDRLLYSGLFEHIFVHSTTCERIVSDKNTRKGINVGVSCLLNGYDADLHKIDENADKQIDILFIGSVTKRRKKLLERFKDEGLNITVCEGIFGDEFVQKVNSAKIVINVHSSTRPDTETRVFEVLGCGGFLVSEPLSGENPFIPGKHFVEADISDFTSVVKRYLDDEEERTKISLCGHEEAVKKHSYYERTKQDIVPILQEAIDGCDRHCPDRKQVLDQNLLFRYEKKQRSQISRAIKKVYIKCFNKYQQLWDRLIDLYEKR